MRRLLVAALLLAALPQPRCAAKKKSGSKKSAEEPILELTDATVEDALEKNPLMLISFTVPGCADCELVAKALRQAKAELRVQSADSVTLAQLTITSQESPAVARITQGQLQLPKLLVFRDGEAMDYTGTELTKKDIVSTMLREYSRPSVQALSSVKQTERFLHLDSWSAQHADEEQPPRVVGFFPSNGTAGYAVYRARDGVEAPGDDLVRRVLRPGDPEEVSRRAGAQDDRPGGEGRQEGAQGAVRRPARRAADGAVGGDALARARAGPHDRVVNLRPHGARRPRLPAAYA